MCLISIYLQIIEGDSMGVAVDANTTIDDIWMQVTNESGNALTANWLVVAPSSWWTVNVKTGMLAHCFESANGDTRDVQQLEPGHETKLVRKPDSFQPKKSPIILEAQHLTPNLRIQLPSNAFPHLNVPNTQALSLLATRTSTNQFPVSYSSSHHSLPNDESPRLSWCDSGFFVEDGGKQTGKS